MTDYEHSVRRGLDDAARSAATQLEQAAARDAARTGVGRAMLLVVMLPAAALLVQLLRLAAGREPGISPGTWFTWWLIPLSLVPAVAFLVWRFARGRREVARARALAALDRRLDTADRLQTADEFLAAPRRSGFMQAAIEDAADCVKHAQSADVRPPAAPITAVMVERIGVPIALVLLALAFWLSTVQTASRSNPQLASNVVLAGGVAEEARPVDEVTPPPTPAATPDPPPSPTREPRKDRSPARASAPVSRTIPDGAEQAEGTLGVGETSESDQSSNPSNARGAPSSQGQPSKPGKKPKKKAGKTTRKPPDQQQKEQPQKDAEDPAGSTAGQGSSKGSNQNPATSDWSSRDQVETPEDDQLDEEQDVDDEEEEQESRGGMQPNLRDRRPPVNRDLRIGFGNRSNPDANGRGGPGQQKKSRGVASFVLGVPIPDRVKGQPNPGKTKVTQQRIEPEPEQQEPAAAEARTPRADAIGPVFHPVLNPSLRELVRAYFLQQRSPAARTGPPWTSDR